MRSGDFYFCEATPEDDASIRALLETPEFGGDLQIIYGRGDHPLASFQRDGEEVFVLLGKRGDGELVGLGVCSLWESWVDRKRERIAYLSALRVAKAYRGKTLRLMEAYRMMMDWISKRGVRFVLTTILEDHRGVQQMFERRRQSMPWYLFVRNFHVWVIPARFCPLPRGKEILRGDEVDGDCLREFYREEGKKKNFFPCDRALEEPSRIRLLMEKGEIEAALFLEERLDKEHRLYAYGGKYRALKYLRGFLPLFGYPHLPKEGALLHYDDLSSPLCKEGKEENLLRLMGSVARVSKKHYLLAGSMEGEALDDTLKGYLPMHYDSRLYLVDDRKDGFLEAWIQEQKKIHLETSLL